MTSAQRRKLNESLTAYAYLAPAGAVLLVFWFIPVAISLVMSFGNLTALLPWSEFKFVGTAQYQRAFSDEIFVKSFWNTVNYAIWHVPLTLILSLAAALLMNSKIKGRGFFRVAFFLPYITTWVAISIVWQYIFHREYGLAQWFLNILSTDVFGFEKPWRLEWLSEPRGIFEMMFGGTVPKMPLGINELFAGPSLALFSIIITSIWRDIGYYMVIFLAGLQNIDKTFYEAASIDGANAWQRFWHVTWPLLSPVTFFLLIISLIGSFQVFVPMLIMTPTGGIENSTSPLVFYIYEVGFRGNWQLSYAAAIAYILTAMILLLTVIQNKVVGKRVVYQ